jgi:hypothetical protein
MGDRSLAAIDADLVLVEHELGLAKPYQQQCADTYAALESRRDELEREREEAENPGRISRLPVGYGRESPDAGVSPLAGEGTKADAQLIFISGHGGRVVIDEPASVWPATTETRKRHEDEPPPPPGEKEFGPENPYGLGSEKEREAFFEDLKEAKFEELRKLKEQVYRHCVEHSATKNKFCWGIQKKDMVKVGHEFLHKDFAPKLEELLEAARKDLEEDRKAGDEQALKTIAIGVASGCRNAQEQLTLWGKGFTVNLYRGAQIPIKGPKDPRILDGGAKFRIDQRALALAQIGLGGPKLATGEDVGKVDYEIRWQMKGKKGYIDCKFEEATHVFITNLALLRLAKGGVTGQAAVDYMAAFIGARIGTPGYSRHQLGIAADFSPPEKGLKISSVPSESAKWISTWLFAWLLKRGNAELHGMKNYKPEPWHWEDKSAAP